MTSISLGRIVGGTLLLLNALYWFTIEDGAIIMWFNILVGTYLVWTSVASIDWDDDDDDFQHMQRV